MRQAAAFLAERLRPTAALDPGRVKRLRLELDIALAEQALVPAGTALPCRSETLTCVRVTE